ncbi:MAG TPA: hypothetical protein VKB34_15620 [Povalibacter sp.]|nr:hypothetical protein [Povalibacter sp.]
MTNDPAGGFDERMPHDLIHFVVERELGLQCGIFGQVAAGGTAGSFFPVVSQTLTVREAARRRRALSKRSGKLMQAGRRDTAVSEAATYLVHGAWQARRTDMVAKPHHADPTAATRSGFISALQLTRIFDQLDALSTRWSALEIGESMTVNWPSRGRG